MTNYTLRQVEYFCSVASAGTLSGAADALLVSRSALASGLDELEKALHVKLFRRQRAAGVELTAEGLDFLDGALDLLRFSEDLAARVSEKTLRGQLNVGCFSSLAPTVLPVMIELFESQYPHVDVIVEAESQNHLLNKLHSGQLELAIVYETEHWPHLASAKLFDARMHIIVGKTHELANHAVVNVNDLAHHPFILLDTPPSPAAGMKYLRAHNIAPSIRHRTSHFELVRSLVARRQGYSLFIQQPEAAVSYEGYEIVALPLSPSPEPERAAIVWPRDRTLSARAKRFVELAQEHSSEFAPASLYRDMPEA